MRVECLEPLIGADLDDDFPAALDTPLKEVGQNGFKRSALQVIEEELGQPGWSVERSCRARRNSSSRRTPKPEPQDWFVSFAGEPIAVPATSRCAQGVSFST